MSNWDRAIPVLAEMTGLPVFVRMRDEGVVLPVSVGLHRHALAQVAPGTSKRAVRTAFQKMARSRRYLAACVADGAMRHGADGMPLAPVSEGQRSWARMILAKKAAFHNGNGKKVQA
jgi:sRNA-binding protein